jgi:hypothetical protein
MSSYLSQSELVHLDELLSTEPFSESKEQLKEHTTCSKQLSVSRRSRYVSNRTRLTHSSLFDSILGKGTPSKEQKIEEERLVIELLQTIHC